MAASPQHHTLRLIAPTLPLPLRRRRSRLSEPTVIYELVIVDGATTLGRERHRRQARAVRDALQWFADHPPNGEPHSTTEPQPAQHT
jgi:hypothetical protein